MSARRGAVKVNPVTGKMEKYDPGAVPEGKHRDGCLLVDDRYVNAAKDLGLGGANGAWCAGARGGGREQRAPWPLQLLGPGPTSHSRPFPLHTPPPLPPILFSPQACTAT